jgi:hypothetical protein
MDPIPYPLSQMTLTGVNEDLYVTPAVLNALFFLGHDSGHNGRMVGWYIGMNFPGDEFSCGMNFPGMNYPTAQ